MKISLLKIFIYFLRKKKKRQLPQKDIKIKFFLNDDQ